MGIRDVILSIKFVIFVGLKITFCGFIVATLCVYMDHFLSRKMLVLESKDLNFAGLYAGLKTHFVGLKISLCGFKDFICESKGVILKL